MNDSLKRANEEDLLHELSYYTLAHSDPFFIHQHVVDAFAAQHANETTKPITIVFALVGLYLHVEKGFTGRQVQKSHMQLARLRRKWIRLTLPETRGRIGIADVLAEDPGPKRDAAIHCWCSSVWEAYSELRNLVATLVQDELDIQ